jgi:hypothetical protein
MGKSDFHSTGLTAQPSPLTGSLGICNPINLSQSAKYAAGAAGATSNGFFCPISPHCCELIPGHQAALSKMRTHGQNPMVMNASL